MNKIMQHKIILLFVIFFLSTDMISESEHTYRTYIFNKILLYDNIWGTIYNPEVRQCDDSPTITGDGSVINPNDASSHRWIAISQEMLNCVKRANIINDPNDKRFKGKIKYGDTVWIESPYPNINGIWIVHDVKNAKYMRSIDFLQTKGDYSLFNNNPLWSGKFENIKIYKYNSNLRDL